MSFGLPSPPGAARALVGVAVALLLGAGCSKGAGAPRADAAAPDALTGVSCTGGGASANGQPCACAADCHSGFCADGVCCDTACTETCKACNVPGAPGVCSFVPAGAPPVVAGSCPRSPVGSCGLDGTCDGQGSCRSYPAGSVCQAGACQGAAVIGTQVCDGAGRCEAGPQTICAPFGCDAASGTCFSSCRSDADCVAGVKCVAGSCGPKPQGAACTKASECASGFCADGLCCNVACSGPCVSCNQPSRQGTCWPVEAGLGDPHGVCRDQGAAACGQTGACDGVGSCAMYRVGTVCAAAACSGDRLSPAGTCDGLGSCRTGAAQSCAPYRCVNGACVDRCTSDADCVTGQSCQNGSCGPKPNGQPCAAAAECGSGFCVDGVCCDSACTSACRSCAVASAVGTCTAVPAGAADPRGVCRDQGAASCGTDGRCDGAGACRKYQAGTACGGERCAGGSYTAPSTCDGSGSCVAPAAVSCAPFACNGSRCFTACTTDANCAPGNSCSGSACGKPTVTLGADGAACTADAQCASGHCTDGVCCDVASCGACHSCGLKGSAGTCAPVADGTACGTAVCSTLVGAIVGAQCTKGLCASITLTDCAPFNCDPATDACITVCKNAGDCAPGRSCNASGGGGGRTCN